MILNVQCPLIIQNFSSGSVAAGSMEYFVESVLTPYKALDIAFFFFFGRTLDTKLFLQFPLLKMEYDNCNSSFSICSYLDSG